MIPKYLDFSFPKGREVHIAITGSIAAYKCLEIIRELVKREIKVSVSLSKAAINFVTPTTIKGLGVEVLHTDMFEQESLYSHLYPGIDPEVFAVVPATANIIAKIANGIADDLISCQILAFDKQIIVAPAMNPRMWNAPATKKNISQILKYGICVVEPEVGDVACGEYGRGRLAHINEIYFHILKALSPQDLSGKKVLITLGPTREYFDPVRFWSNPSSGKMGAALATSAWMRGADVTCIMGDVDIWLPKEIKKINVISAREMFEATTTIWKDFDIGALCAAVCDFCPSQKFEEKFKKEMAKEKLLIEFEKNPDILKTLGSMKEKHQLLIGFAAETEKNFVGLAKEKMNRKNLDFIVANQINVKNSGFKSDKNRVVIVSKQGKVKDLKLMSKADVAWEIWNCVTKN